MAGNCAICLNLQSERHSITSVYDFDTSDNVNTSDYITLNSFPAITSNSACISESVICDNAKSEKSGVVSNKKFWKK